jgi:hypothetical protein
MTTLSRWIVVVTILIASLALVMALVEDDPVQQTLYWVRATYFMTLALFWQWEGDRRDR